MSFWLGLSALWDPHRSSACLKTVILVENHPQKQIWLAEYHPLGGYLSHDPRPPFRRPEILPRLIKGPIPMQCWSSGAVAPREVAWWAHLRRRLHGTGPLAPPQTTLGGSVVSAGLSRHAAHICNHVLGSRGFAGGAHNAAHHCILSLRHLY